MLSSPRRTKLRGSVRMGWIQRRHRVLPTARPAALTSCCQWSWRTGKVGTAGLWASSVGGQCAQLQSHHAKLYLFPFWWTRVADNNCASAGLKCQPSHCSAGSLGWFSTHHMHSFFESNSGNQWEIHLLYKTPTWCELESDLIFLMVIVCLYPEW